MALGRFKWEGCRCWPSRSCQSGAFAPPRDSPTPAAIPCIFNRFVLLRSTNLSHATAVRILVTTFGPDDALSAQCRGHSCLRVVRACVQSALRYGGLQIAWIGLGVVVEWSSAVWGLRRPYSDWATVENFLQTRCLGIPMSAGYQL